jgi:alanyl aminopeptidase
MSAPRSPRSALPALALSTLGLLASVACGPASPEAVPPSAATAPPTATPPLGLLPEATPLGRLPPDTRPTRYRLELRVDPSLPRFDGTADIGVELDRLREVIWIHGRDLEVKTVTVQPEGFAPVAARWEPASKSGVVALRPAAPVGPGRVTVHVEYSAPFVHADEGLAVKERGADRYAVSQFESTFARRAFPSFDEPAFKTPFETVLHVPAGLQAISNTREIARAAEALPDPGKPGATLPYVRVAFAPTEKLPSYLVAFAVGPFDVVDAPPIPPSTIRKRPLPLRGVATRGRGKELAYALAHTGALVEALEAYFGIEYPYDKLDMIAVPEKGGAMENAGAITFGEFLLLMDAKSPPVDQRTGFALVAAHELAHQWFGDLVTTAWWDELWLNEAFATWAETRIVAAVSPELDAGVHALRGTHYAMAEDSLVSARKIRQEIRSDDDIENAFDGITYEKGAAVIGMFEHWMGPEAFQKGIRAHLAAHRHGTASGAELLGALSTAAGRDIATPFRTFLEQPGLPFVEGRVSCEGAPRLLVKQSRFLPLGSAGSDKMTWQIPICARYPAGKELLESCALLDGAEGSVPLPGASCPAWAMPNADANGYYRWSLSPADTKNLAGAGLGRLGERERLSFAESIQAGYVRARLPAADALAALAPLAADRNGAVAAAPLRLLAPFSDWLHGDPRHAALEAFAQKLYAPVHKALGWAPAAGAAEPADRSLLRPQVIDLLAFTARDPAVRREAAARGRAFLDGKADAVIPELLGTALTVAMEEGDAALFDKLLARLAVEQAPRERYAILRALGRATRPELAVRARALVLDASVHLSPREVLAPLQVQLGQPALRDAAWAWARQNVDALLGRLPERRRSAIVWLPVGFCDARHAAELKALFEPRLAEIPGGPRDLAGAVEDLELCAAERAAQEPSVRAFFDKKGR